MKMAKLPWEEPTNETTYQETAERTAHNESSPQCEVLCIRMIEIGKIDEVFNLSGREGITLVPGISHDALIEPIKVGTPIRIKNPDASELDSKISGIEMVSSKKLGRYSPIMLPAGITTEDVKKGALIYIFE